MLPQIYLIGYCRDELSGPSELSLKIQNLLIFIDVFFHLFGLYITSAELPLDHSDSLDFFLEILLGKIDILLAIRLDLIAFQKTLEKLAPIDHLLELLFNLLNQIAILFLLAQNLLKSNFLILVLIIC